jgi:abortive infection bacteriophage resistance protein
MTLKPAFTIEQQIKLLKSRGCIIDNEDSCMKFLSSVNYYRLTAYFLPFKNPDGITYKPNTNFSIVQQIYEFDKQLRNLLLSVVEDIEIFVRTKIAYHHAHAYGALGYENPGNYNNKHNHKNFTDLMQSEINKKKNVLFVKHHINNYAGKLPIWVIIELFSFGMLSRFYADLPLSDRKVLAKDMFGFDESIIRSWLHCCTSLRNICAHYDRIYYRHLGAKPATPKNYPVTLNNEMFSSIIMLKLMFPDKDKWDNTFISALSSLICKYSDSINLQHIGFPIDWKQKLLNTIPKPLSKAEIRQKRKRELYPSRNRCRLCKGHRSCDNISITPKLNNFYPIYLEIPLI